MLRTMTYLFYQEVSTLFSPFAILPDANAIFSTINVLPLSHLVEIEKGEDVRKGDGRYIASYGNHSIFGFIYLSALLPHRGKSFALHYTLFPS